MARNTHRAKRPPTADEIRRETRARVDAARQALRATVLGPLADVLTVCEEPRDGARFGAVDPAMRRAWLNLDRNADLTPEHWTFVLGHLALHVGFEHASRGRGRDPFVWNVACELAVDTFLRAFKIGRCPEAIERLELCEGREEDLYERLGREPALLARVGAHTLAGVHRADLRDADGVAGSSRSLLSGGAYNNTARSPEELLAAGIRQGVERAIAQAAERLEGAAVGGPRSFAPVERARRHVLADLPLLGALVTRMKLVCDAELCARLGVGIAAVDPFVGEIYFNPRWNFGDDEWLFVLVHELLHVALLHHARRRGRDPLVWNYAGDFVINAWLLEMGVGRPPSVGLLFDPALRGLSVEEVYDLLAKSPRKCRGLRTFRGDAGDILWNERGVSLTRGEVTTLDDVYKRCLEQGLRCAERGRGLIPLGLIEEIQSLFTPPVPWDVQLARWMEAHVPYVREPLRSYARASRRQSSTPDIPRPARYVPHEWKEACTFGVVLDTSGSMDRALLGRALGAIASFAEARDVAAVRVVLCDARPYDRGPVMPSELRGTVPVAGRGGTRLQPAIGYLVSRPDFPADAPVMVLTDGLCEETLVCGREHCFVLPRDPGEVSLRTTAPVFYALKEAG